MTRQMEAQLFLVKMEPAKFIAAKNHWAADRRVLTKNQTGIFNKGLKKIRRENINKDNQVLERLIH